MAVGLMTAKVVCLIESLLEYRYRFCAWLFPYSLSVSCDLFYQFYEFDCCFRSVANFVCCIRIFVGNLRHE